MVVILSGFQGVNRSVAEAEIFLENCVNAMPAEFMNSWDQLFVVSFGRINDIMGLLPDTQNCGLRMLQECRERDARAVRHAGITN